MLDSPWGEGLTWLIIKFAVNIVLEERMLVTFKRKLSWSWKEFACVFQRCSMHFWPGLYHPNC